MTQTEKYRQELREIDSDFRVLEEIVSSELSRGALSFFAKDLIDVHKRLRKFIKGPFDPKTYHKTYYAKNKENIKKYQKEYRS